MKRFLIDMAILGVLQLTLRFILSLFGIQWEVIAYIVGGASVYLYLELRKSIFDELDEQEDNVCPDHCLGCESGDPAIQGCLSSIKRANNN